MMNNVDRLLQFIEQKAIERAEKIERKLAIGAERVLFLISPMAYCNFNCIYCSIYGFNTKADPSKNLSLDRILKFVDIVIDYKKRHPQTTITITWHGYEPLQYNFNAYKAVDKKIFEAGLHELNHSEDVVPITLGVQTNGYLLTEDKIKFFYERRWRVSLSLDGPREVQDFNRRTRANTPSYDIIMRNVEIYEKYFGRKPPIISVWSRKHLEIGPEGYYNWLKENRFMQADIHHPSVLPNNPNINKFSAIDEAIEWFKELYYIWSNDNSGIILYPFYSYIQALVVGRGRGRACFLQNGCFRVIELSHDGYFRFCDRGIYNLEKHIDNLNKLEELFNTKAHVKLFMRPMVLKYYHPDCSNCKWFSVCQGGCPSEAEYTTLVYKNNLFGEPLWNRTYNCKFHKAMFETIYNDLKQKGIELGIKV